MAGVLLAGCGIPSETDVRVDGPVSDPGLSDTSDTPTTPPGPDQADSEEELVEYFLLAAAADPDDPLDALRAFIHPEERDDWQPDPQVLLVRSGTGFRALPDEDPVPIRVPVREIGVLNPGGVIEPRSGSSERDVEFQVVESAEVRTDEGQVGVDVGEPRFWLVDPPNEILLSEAALDTPHRLLLPHPIYFRASDGDALVPDLRWLPSALSERQRPQTVLEWLRDGPAPWLRSAVVDLPDNVALAGNVVWSDDRVDVALSPGAADIDPTELDAQLWWTLRPVLRGDRTLVVTIDGQEREVSGDYESQNPTTRPGPARFAVLDGEIRQLPPGEALDLPALADGGNTDVHNAAISWDRRAAALVRVDSDDLRRLFVARPGGSVDTGLVGSGMGRPAWLASGQIGLVVADGELFRFTREGDWSEVPVPDDLDGLEAIAAAPDARRLALVADGRLYVASMVWRDGSFSVNEPRLLPTTATDLSGVGFLQESRLAIVGQDDDRPRLYEITVDGAVERELDGSLGTPSSVDSFVAYPGNPLGAVPTADARGEIMFELEDRAHRYVDRQGAVQIRAEDLYGVSADDDEVGDPQAPFFLD
jgi:hypothetical protein